MTAMSLLVYRLTGEATSVGISVAAQFLPMLVLGAWAGVIADTYDKRTMAIITQSGLAAQALLLGALDLAGLVTLPLVYGLSLVLGIVAAFDNPARRGLVTELVPTPDIPKRDIAEHRRHDRLADLRPRDGRGPRGHDRHGLVLHLQRPHLHRDHLLARRDSARGDVPDASAPQGWQADPGSVALRCQPS